MKRKMSFGGIVASGFITGALVVALVALTRVTSSALTLFDIWYWVTLGYVIGAGLERQRTGGNDK